ncbi:peptide deformylase [Patescibacteria group bacterium]|nr:peptide deformylase [Patescibacteria group bacterium]MBU1721464.1 peptide deformylase [Patescibacteria group bacterium]MBU1900779.1 peptide deformylase [Patescibacteria group bacterium]
MILPITTYPTPSLFEASEHIDAPFLLRKETQTLIDNMIDTMYADDGIGLAAPQIGKNIQLCVIGRDAFKDHDNPQDTALINPRWEPMSRKKVWDTEGCLSVPKTYGKVRRYKEIRVVAKDRTGKELIFEAKGFLARVIQHEVDHLNGILFIDKAKGIYTV